MEDGNGNPSEQKRFWNDYIQLLEQSVPEEDSVSRVVKSIESLNFLSCTSVDIDGMVAAFADVCRREGEEKVRKIIKETWSNEPRIIRVIRELAPYAGSASYLITWYDSLKKYREEVEALISILDSYEMTYIVSGTCYGKGEDTVVIQVDPGDISFTGTLYALSVRGVLIKALESSGAFVIRLCDEQRNRYLLYGIRFKNGGVESISVDDLRRTLEEQPDGTHVQLRPNEIPEVLLNRLSEVRRNKIN